MIVKEINNTQIVIYGKNGHAEVNGLLGQTESSAIVIEKKEDPKNSIFLKYLFILSGQQNRWMDFKR